MSAAAGTAGECSRTPAIPGAFETFYAESWLEHLRQHERVTVVDRAADERVRALVASEPVVTHLVAARKD